MARILIMGTGGVGGCFGAELHAAGHDVWFVARGDNLRALREQGLRVTGARGAFTVPPGRASAVAADAGDRDLILLCVKSYDLTVACEGVAACGGIVLTVQNGVDAAQRARGVLGEVVLAGTTNVVADLAAPGKVVVSSSYARITFGEPDGGPSERTELVAGWLRSSGIEAVVPDDVRVGLWEKMGNICAMAGLTTLFDATVGVILSDADGSRTFRGVVDEVGAVARASGIGIDDGYEEARMAWARQIPPDATSSMSRDLRRGKRLEIDHLNGAIVRYGDELGVPVPLNRLVYAGVRLRAAARG